MCCGVVPGNRTIAALSSTASSRTRNRMRSSTTTSAAVSTPGVASTRRSAEARVSAVETPNRVQLAASHWKPRFVANGVDVNDFERALAEGGDWAEWRPPWKRVGDMHRALAEDATAARHLLTATAAFQRAAWSYHLGKFLWFENRALHLELSALTVAT